AFPQPAPGKAASAGPRKDVPAGKLRSLLGITKGGLVRGKGPLAIVDPTLEEPDEEPGMSWKPVAVVLAAPAALCRPEASRAAAGPGAPKGLAAEVLAVFSAKCAGCHGAGLARPRGGFGYVLDLRRLAANPGMVVPSKPDESDLWAQV